MTGVTATTQATLCRIFAGVLGLDLVRPGDAFFDVGGDSVLALQVVARAREAGLALTVRDLFDHQTPGELAAVTSDLPDPASARGAAAPSLADTEPPLLTFSADELDEFKQFDEFEDIEAGQYSSDTQAGWETFT